MTRNKKTPDWDAKSIKALRQHLRLTQSDMAGQLGMRQQTVSEWEVDLYGPRGASARLLSMIADRSKFKYEA